LLDNAFQERVIEAIRITKPRQKAQIGQRQIVRLGPHFVEPAALLDEFPRPVESETHLLGAELVGRLCINHRGDSVGEEQIVWNMPARA
jgi:hypothetical protein